MIEIKCRFSGKVLFTHEGDSLKVAVEAAVKAKATLDGATLYGATLDGANLSRAKIHSSTRMETGETWETYLKETLPALMQAGGKSVSDVLKGWDCHAWENCPMSIAFDIHGTADLEGIALLLKPRIDQFVRYFDAKLIPCPVAPKAGKKVTKKAKTAPKGEREE